MNEITPAIDAHRTMLLVMDYQPAILNRLSDADELLTRMAEVIHTARTSGVQIGYVRVVFDDSDYAVMPEANETLRAIAAGRHMYHEDPETAIHDDVAPEPGDLIVRKSRIGAFSTTDLDLQLRNRKIDTLILAGIATSGVVLSTVPPRMWQWLDLEPPDCLQPVPRRRLGQRPLPPYYFETSCNLLSRASAILAMFL